jgi:hypothetical protein
MLIHPFLLVLRLLKLFRLPALLCMSFKFLLLSRFPQAPSILCHPLSLVLRIQMLKSFKPQAPPQTANELVGVSAATINDPALVSRLEENRNELPSSRDAIAQLELNHPTPLQFHAECPECAHHWQHFYDPDLPDNEI